MTKSELLSRLMKLRQEQRAHNDPEGDHEELEQLLFSWLRSEHAEVYFLCREVKMHAKWWVFA